MNDYQFYHILALLWWLMASQTKPLIPHSSLMNSIALIPFTMTPSTLGDSPCAGCSGELN